MIIAGLPVAASEIHHLARNWVRMALLREDPLAVAARFGFLYFSYAPDFDYLSLSLQSLAKAVHPSWIRSVTIAEDQKAPFSEEQREQLARYMPALHWMPVHDFEWGSPRSTHAELQVFERVCRNMPDDHDLLVKVDSDVLFLSNRKWELLLRSRALAIGDGHYLQHRFAQGGLYMIRRHVVRHVLSKVSLAEIEAVAKKIDSVGEDMAISQLLRDAGSPFFMSRMMLFPEEYRPLRRLNRLVRSEFLALHFHKDKSNMAALARQHGLVEEAVPR